MANSVAMKKLILVPAVITLAVTLLRLLGELLHWSTVLFNPAPAEGARSSASPGSCPSSACTSR